MTVPDGQGQTRPISDLAASFLRTYVPLGVGALLAFAATRWGLVLPVEASAGVGVAATAACVAGWYGLGRFLERRRGDSWPAVVARSVARWMLGGVIRQPVYAAVGDTIRVIAEGKARKLP